MSETERKPREPKPGSRTDKGRKREEWNRGPIPNRESISNTRPAPPDTQAGEVSRY